MQVGRTAGRCAEPRRHGVAAPPTMGNDLGKHLETAEKTGALNLSGNQLKKLPEKVVQLSKLRTLDLSKNSLKSVPEGLGAMTQMKHFNLSHNAVQRLPPSVRLPPLPPPQTHA